jgi:hypothetical protein
VGTLRMLRLPHRWAQEWLPIGNRRRHSETTSPHTNPGCLPPVPEALGEVIGGTVDLPVKWGKH